MTTVSAAVFKVLKPNNNAVVSWSTAISGATATSLVLTHTFSAAPTEVDVSGVYIIYAELTVPGGTLTTTRIRREAKGLFEL
jgi:hypothetical protein